MGYNIEYEGHGSDEKYFSGKIILEGKRTGEQPKEEDIGLKA